MSEYNFFRNFGDLSGDSVVTDIEFDCKVYKTDQYIQSSRDFYVFENDSGIVNHSKNIIDLIEVRRLYEWLKSNKYII